MREDTIETATKDVLTLARSGARALTKDLDEEVADKKAELTQLKKSAKAFNKLADDGDFTDPIEVTYTHTVRKPSKGLVTRVEIVELNDAGEARDTAAAIEKKLETWGKLREEMMGVLKHRQKQLEEMKKELPNFVASLEGLVGEVFATLY